MIFLSDKGDCFNFVKGRDGQMPLFGVIFRQVAGGLSVEAPCQAAAALSFVSVD